MTVKHRILYIFAAALLLSSAGNRVVQAQSTDELAAIAKRYPGIDPRNTFYVAPPVNESDYEPYFKSGSSELVVKPIFKLADGSKTLCQVHPFEAAYLYPRTPYTVWLIENWIFQLQKSGQRQLLTSTPGAYFHQYLKPYLSIDSDSNVIRVSVCNANHEFVFRNLPVGKYVLYIYHVNFVEESHERYNTQTVMTPDGPHNQVIPGSIEDSSHITDGYIDYGRGEVVVDKPSYRYTLDAADFPTVLHFLENHDD